MSTRRSASGALRRGARRCCLLRFLCHTIPPFRILADRSWVQTSTFRNLLYTADARLQARKVHAKRAPDYANLARVFHVTFALLRAFLSAFLRTLRVAFR